MYFGEDDNNSLNIKSELSRSQLKEMLILLNRFTAVIRDKLDLTKEVDKMLELGLIEPSAHQWC